MIVYPKTLAEAEQLLEYLNKNKEIEPDEAESEILIKVFNTTEYMGLRDLIALILARQKNETFFKLLILRIRANIHTQYLCGLIFAASHYDCYQHFQVFIDAIILKDNMAYFDAIHVIRQMDLSGVSVEDAEYGVNKLDAHLATLDKSKMKFGHINSLAKYLEDFDNYDD